MIVPFRRLKTDAVIPTKGTIGAACYDCYLPEQLDPIMPGERRIIQLGFQLEVPMGYKAMIYGRSGLAHKGIQTHIGTIDSDYRGEVGAIITNFSPMIQPLNKGDRICQLSIEKVIGFQFEEVDEIGETERGEGGFGSTGINNEKAAQ